MKDGKSCSFPKIGRNSWENKYTTQCFIHKLTRTYRFTVKAHFKKSKEPQKPEKVGKESA